MGKLPSLEPHLPTTYHQKDAVIVALTGAVRVLAEQLPADSLGRYMCTAALAAQQAISQHG